MFREILESSKDVEKITYDTVAWLLQRYFDENLKGNKGKKEFQKEFPDGDENDAIDWQYEMLEGILDEDMNSGSDFLTTVFNNLEDEDLADEAEEKYSDVEGLILDMAEEWRDDDKIYKMIQKNAKKLVK